MRMTPMRAVLVGWILCAGAAFSLAGVAAAPATAMDGSGRKVYRLGDVEITAWTDVTIGGLEYSTNLYFIAENTGSRTVTLHVPAAETIATPSWAFHFYDFQPPEIELDPGEKRTLEYMISNEGRGQATLRFPFRTEGARASSRTIKVKLLSADSGGFDSLPADGTVSGTVRTSAGEPVAGADVTVYLFSGRNWVHTTTGPDGSFSVSVPTIATLEEALGDRPLPYASLDYFVNVSADGYTFGYADGLEPASARAAQAEIVVNPVSLPEYRQVAEMSSDYEHGFFWVKAGEDGYAAVQGRHPPELHVPGEIVFFDDAGKVRWRHETGDECWGFDVRRGRIAAACHDGSVLLYDEDGGLLWSHDVGTMTRAIGLSPNGKWAFTGPWDVGGQNADGALVTARDGKLVWSWSDEQRWLRHVRFDRRSKLIAAGFSGGQLVLFTRASCCGSSASASSRCCWRSTRRGTCTPPARTASCSPTTATASCASAGASPTTWSRPAPRTSTAAASASRSAPSAAWCSCSTPRARFSGGAGCPTATRARGTTPCT